jgi:hypothetical protein|tara:strand:- start:106 stop:270 length:165 start_codon:yes stop_codon:yes gene_type:complete
MSVFSKYIQRQIRKKGLTGIVMYVVKLYVKSTPSKKDDKFVEKVEKMFRDFEGK